jgi:hypothetical protein
MRSSKVKSAILTIVFVCACVGASRPAHAQLQTVIPSTGPQVMPGHVLISLQPIGPMVLFSKNGYGDTLYKLGIAMAGQVRPLQSGTFWVGGELNFGGAPEAMNGQLALIEPGIFAKVTFEKALSVPVVPYFRGGISGGINVYYGQPMMPSQTSGDFWFKLGGGVDFFITKNVAIGFQTDLALGALIANVNGYTSSGFVGYWDLLAGLDLAF